MQEVMIKVFLHDSLKTIMPKQIYEKLLVEAEKEEREKVINEKAVYLNVIQRNPDQLQMLQGKSSIPGIVRQELD